MGFTSSELDSFLDEDFGEEAGYIYFGDGAATVPTPIRIIFEEQYQLVLDGVDSTAPSAFIKSADIVTYDIKHGDEIVISDQNYRITGMRIQGDGLTLLILEISED